MTSVIQSAAVKERMLVILLLVSVLQFSLYHYNQLDVLVPAILDGGSCLSVS